MWFDHYISYLHTKYRMTLAWKTNTSVLSSSFLGKRALFWELEYQVRVLDTSVE